MDINAEMCLMKQNLRNEGLSTKGLFIQEFKNMSIEDEKKWCKARKRAKARIAELANVFPHAFGAYNQEKYNRDFIGRFM